MKCNSNFSFSRRLPLFQFRQKVSPCSFSFLLPNTSAIKTFAVNCSSRRPEGRHRRGKPNNPLDFFFKPVVITIAVTATAAIVLSGRGNPNVPAYSGMSDSDTLLDLSSVDEQRKIELLQKKIEDLVRKGKLSDAFAVVDDMIAIRPRDNEGHLLKAHLYYHGGFFESARVIFEAILKKDPLVVEAYHGLMMIAAQEDNKNSGGNLQRVLDGIESAMETCKVENWRDDLRDFKLLMSQVAVMNGNYDNAITLYSELIDDDPKDFRPYLCQGVVYTLLSREDEADKNFSKYKTLVPKDHPYAKYFERDMTVMKSFGQQRPTVE